MTDEATPREVGSNSIDDFASSRQNVSQEAKQATPHALLIEALIDSRFAKTEREHAAAREIEKLRHVVLHLASVVTGIAFEMPAPNAYTPRFAAAAIAATNAIPPGGSGKRALDAMADDAKRLGLEY